MSSKKLLPNGEAAPEGSVGRHGNQRTLGIVLALSGLAVVVSVVTLLYVGRELTFLRAQQEALHRDLRDQQEKDHDQLVLLRSQLQDLMQGKHELGAKCWSDRPTPSPEVATTPRPTSTSPRDAGTTAAPRRTQVTAATSTEPADGGAQASDCAELYAAGQTTSGVYNIRLGSSNVETYCDMDTAGGGWTVIQRRQDGSVPFNRTWDEYKHGFGNKSGEYWLGNENIHLLTNQKNYTLRVDLQDWGGQTRCATYSSFRVSGESDQYRLRISGYSGTAGDSMRYNNGMMFSTVDRDNDAINNYHCSQRNGQGGWWFRGCGYSFLNGRYLGNCGSSCPAAKGVVWFRWRGYSYSLKSVTMKIRP
ncbi:microfibril-associated glycoprotein 4-like [Branchiostoma floridae x Branchiostoma belcheri]